jgi:homoserine dehydrogenase
VRTIPIGLLGLGTVGSGVVRVLRDNAIDIESRLGARLEVRRIAVKHLEKERAVEVDRRLFTERAEDVLDDPEIAIVVELIGGVDEAKRYVLSAIDRQKHLVTANKTLLATSGREIFSRASQRGVDVFYEAAVGGGIPIIRTLREALASERIQSISAIVNGTTNYILSAMSERGAGFAETLAEAQRLGYAEADPSADVDGHDAAQKLAILASLGFGAHVCADQVEVEGIREVSFEDIDNAKKHGYAVKLLAIARRRGDAISACVHPAWVPKDSMLANVNGVLNAFMLESDALGTSVLIGRGAGQLPTGSAVVADIIDVARNVLIGSIGRVPHMATREESFHDAKMFDPQASESAFYLRFSVKDSPGVLAGIAGALGSSGVSLRVVRQEIDSGGTGEPVTLMVVTHAARESSVREAVGRIDAFPTTIGRTRLIRIMA